MAKHQKPNLPRGGKKTSRRRENEPVVARHTGSVVLNDSAGHVQVQNAQEELSTGLVASFVHRCGSGERSFPPSVLIRMLRAGLPVSEVDDLKEVLDIPMVRLADLLGISKATLQRRKMGQLLGQRESDRVVRYARLMGQAVQTLESEEAARSWLNSPQVGLGGEVPLEYARTEVGAREVERLLGRIEHGVYA